MISASFFGVVLLFLTLASGHPIDANVCEQPSDLPSCDTQMGDWRTLNTISPDVTIRILVAEEGSPAPSDVYVICHGMGGTSAGDRFELLGLSLRELDAGSTVVLIDWSPLSQSKLFGFPNPRVVANRIPVVSDAGYQALKNLNVVPENMTFIGESFGNNVNSRISEKFGSSSLVLAFNPANPLGGGGSLDLTRSSRKACSFHTRSCFDSIQAIAHHDALMTMSGDVSMADQHTWGVQWLRERVERQETHWLTLNLNLPVAHPDYFNLVVDPSGVIDKTPQPRIVPNSTPDESQFAERNQEGSEYPQQGSLTEMAAILSR